MTKNLRLVLVQFSFDSRLVLVLPSFVLRSAFVHPSLDNRRSIEEQSKIYRKNNENAMEPQGNNLRAATNKHRYMNERGPLAMLNVECWVLSYSRLKPTMTNYSVLNYFTPLQFNIKHLTLNIGTMPLAMLSFEFWVLNCRQGRCWIVNYELRILNSQLSNSKCA